MKRGLIAAVLAVSFFASTVARAQVWRDPVELWRDAVLKSPEKVRPAAALSLALLAAGRFDEVVTFTESVAAKWPEASADFLEIQGQAFLGLARYEEGAKRFEWAARRNGSERTWMNAGSARYQHWMSGGDSFEQSARNYTRSREEGAIDGVADLMFYSGAWQKAAEIGIDSRDKSAVYIAAKWMMLAGSHDQAAALFQKAEPGWKLAAFNEGASWYSAGKAAKSIAAYKRALDIDPEFREARFNLGLAHYQNRDFAEAAVQMKRSGLLDPKKPEHMKFWRIAQEVHYGS